MLIPVDMARGLTELNKMLLDRKEREANIVVLGFPNEGEALDGVVTDTDKLEKVWEKVGVVSVVSTSEAGCAR